MLYSKCIEFADALAASGKSAKEINESLKSFVGDDEITKDDGTVCEIPVIEEKEKSVHKVDIESIEKEVDTVIEKKITSSKAINIYGANDVTVGYHNIFNKKSKYFDSPEDLYQATSIIMGEVAKMYPVANQLISKYSLKAIQAESSDILGGIFDPTITIPSIIELVNTKFGVIPSNSFSIPLAGSSANVPKLLTDVVVANTTEGSKKNETSKTFEEIEMVLRKVTGYVPISEELISDSIINFVDMIVGNLIRAIANYIDTAGFYGDGTATYSNVNGIIPTMEAVAGNAGIHDIGHTADGGPAWDQITMADLAHLMSIIAPYAWDDQSAIKWYCSPAFNARVFGRLSAQAGGNNMMDIGGKWSPSFLGYPVETTSILPKDENSNPSTTDIVCLFGDMAKACIYAYKGGTTIASSSEALFLYNQVVIRGESRFNFVDHEPGTDTDAGPLVALSI